MMFADVHSHILFGIDDGARSIGETRHILQGLHQSGVTHLAFTPHYYPYKDSIDSFVEKREKAFQAVTNLAEAEKFVFSLGSEVYLGETLLSNATLSPLCYRGTRYMLTELEYSDYFTDATKYRLLRLIEDFGVIPVLAHIHRYPFLWKDLRLLEQLKKMGCCFQINLSVLQGFFSRLRAVRLYELGFVDFLGEDAHRSCLSFEEKEKLFARVERSHKGFSEKMSQNVRSRLFIS